MDWSKLRGTPLINDQEEDIDAFDALCLKHGFEPPAWSGVGAGWLPILDVLFGRLRAAGVTSLGQVKEKFGTLRVYVGDVDSQAVIEAALKEAEAASAVTCEDCGRPGKIRAGGWLRTLCDSCKGDQA